MDETGGGSEDVESRLKISIDATDVKSAQDAIRELAAAEQTRAKGAGASSAAKAEDEYAAKLRKSIEYLKERNRLASDLAKAGYGPKEDTLDDRYRRYVDSQAKERQWNDLLVQRGHRAAEPDAAQLRHEKMLQDRARVFAAPTREQMTPQERGVAAARQYAESHGERQAEQEAREQEMARLGFGPERESRFGGRAALAAGVIGAGVMATMEFGARMHRIDSSAFSSRMQRDEETIRAIPGFGHVYGTAADATRWATGQSDDARKIAEDRAMIPLRTQQFAERLNYQTGPAMQADIARDRAGVMRGLRLDRPDSGIDRGSVQGRIAYAEESRTLPYRQQITTALRERAAAEAEHSRVSKEATRLETDSKQRSKAIDELIERRRKMAGDDVREAEGRSQIRRAWDKVSGAFTSDRVGGHRREMLDSLDNQIKGQTGELAEINNRRKSIESDRRAAHERIGEADQKKAQAEVGLRGEEYQNAAIREQRVEGQAERLARMGVVGRLQGKMALDMVKKQGIDYLPQEILSNAEGYAPEEMKRILQERGEKLLRSRTDLPGEYDRQGIGERRRQTDEAREKVAGARENEVQVSTEAVRQAMEAFSQAVASIIKQTMQDFENKMKLDNMAAATNAGR